MPQTFTVVAKTSTPQTFSGSLPAGSLAVQLSAIPRVHLDTTGVGSAVMQVITSLNGTTWLPYGPQITASNVIGGQGSLYLQSIPAYLSAYLVSVSGVAAQIDVSVN